MKSKNNKITKGMIFAGCSFTWGQGLYYYSNLPTLKEPLPDRYDESLLTVSHKKYMESKRYARLVADHFDTFEHVSPFNGSSNERQVHWWTSCLNNTDSAIGIDCSEVSHLVFQLTQFQRDTFSIEVDGQQHQLKFFDVNRWSGSPELREKFLQWIHHNGLTLEQWIDQYIQAGLYNVKKLLKLCEDQGIKTILFSWPNDFIPFVNADPWLKQRLLTFDYKSVNYSSIQDLMSPDSWQSRGYNPELTIKWDYENFETPPQDSHPSLLCHQVIADNIIKRIEEL